MNCQPLVTFSTILPAATWVISIRRQEEEEFSLPKNKPETSHIKGFGHRFSFLVFEELMRSASRPQ